VYVSYTAPHSGTPVEADDPGIVLRDDGVPVEVLTTARPDDVKGMFDRRITAAPGENWDDSHFKTKPWYLRRRPPTNSAERAAMLAATRQRAEALWVVDRQIRRTVHAIKTSGEADRTVLLFTSDNGYYLGEQRMRQGKTYPHDPALRVPLLISGPGIPHGGIRTDPVTSIDIAPTLADYAGVKPATRVDGVSVLDVVARGDQGWRRAILTETGRSFGELRSTTEAGRRARPGQRRDLRYAIGVRTARYLYADIATGEMELYDLQRDPEQTRNVIRSPGYRHDLRLLRAELRRLRTCDGAECARPMPAALLKSGAPRSRRRSLRHDVRGVTRARRRQAGQASVSRRVCNRRPA
jgi:arylsulfatase A-like enzyme